MTGRAWVGCGLMMLWLFVWIAGYPAGLAPVERLLGVGLHLAGLRPGPVPSVYGLDAVVLLALPLGTLVWLMGNVGHRRLRGA